MSKKISLYIICASMLIFISCEKKDKAVLLPPPGPSQVSDIEMGAKYENQVFFDIDSNKSFTKKNTDWELCFEATKYGWHVRLNGGLLIKAANTKSTNWNATYTKNYIFSSDASNGNRDSTAIGDWADTTNFMLTKDQVYIIDRGDTKAANERYKKLKIQYVDFYKYRIKYANLDGSDSAIFYIIKNYSKNFNYFTFNNKGTQLFDYEPPSTSWDFVFTSYVNIYHEYNPPLSYVVRGVLLNPNGILCAKDSTTGYDNINLSMAKSLTYYKDQDAIGFSWKTYDAPSGKYVTRKHVTYIIKSKKGLYYKLRFIDFYNNKGEKGYPKFEFQRL